LGRLLMVLALGMSLLELAVVGLLALVWVLAVLLVWVLAVLLALALVLAEVVWPAEASFVVEVLD